MLKLKKAGQPRWIKLASGARIKVRPATSEGVLRARAATRVALAGEADPDNDMIGFAFTIALSIWGAIEWEGIGDEAGKPLKLTPANLDTLLRQDVRAFDAMDGQYVMPALARDEEKNGSAPSPSGTSRATARPGAARDIAPPVRSGAKPAPTTSKARKPTKARPSGK